jgi:O-antigen ligase
MTSPVVLGEALVIFALLVIIAVRWRRALVMSLPLLAIFNGLAIPFAGSSMRVDQLVACALIVPLAASMLIGTRRLRTDSTMWWLAAILVMNVVATALNSPARSYSLAQCVNLASVWIIYPLLLNFLDTPDELEAFLRRVLWAAITGSSIAIGAYVLAVSGMSVGGAEVSASAAERLTKAYGAYGTMVEPNILGSFAAAYLMLAVALFIAVARHGVESIRPVLLRWVIGCAGVALVLSFTRAAWLAALVGVVCLGARGVRTFGELVRLRRIAVPLGAGVALAVVLLMLPGDAGSLFRFKLFNLVNLGSQTAALRLFTYAMALQQWIDHPLIGWGTFTFAPLAAQGSDFQQFDNWRNLWIGNYLLLALHDTGVVGLVLWLGLLTSILRRAVRAIRALRLTDLFAASTVRALTAAVVVLLVAFLSTSGFSLGFSWLLIGLLGAYGRTRDATPVVPPTTSEPLERAESLGEPSIPAGL